jgi:hypothetical protein
MPVYNSWICSIRETNQQDTTTVVVVRIHFQGKQEEGRQRSLYMYLIRFERLWAQKTRTIILHDSKCEEIKAAEIEIILAYFTNTARAIVSYYEGAASSLGSYEWRLFNTASNGSGQQLIDGGSNISTKPSKRSQRTRSDFNPVRTDDSRPRQGDRLQ